MLRRLGSPVDAKGSYTATTDLKELTLDFDGNDIDEVTVSGRRADYARNGATLRITLPELVKGGTFSTRISYHGGVRQSDGQDPDDFAAFGGFMVKQKNTDGVRRRAGGSRFRDHPRIRNQPSSSRSTSSSPQKVGPNACEWMFHT